MNILVFDKGTLLGTLTVPKPDDNALMTLYEKVSFNNNGTINILYFQDLHYGITITNKMAKNFKTNK
jgi:hypothetical protein